MRKISSHRDSIPGPPRWIGERGSYLEIPLDYSSMFIHEFHINISVLLFTWSLLLRPGCRHQRCEFHCMLFACFWRDSVQWAMASSFTRFLDHTQRRITVGRTALDEWSARRRDLYLTTHDTHNRNYCPRWDSNSQSQQASGRRSTP